ncbi:MAG TPA: hypothetical protein VJ821_09490 [Anaerolineales bacterium]|nr:hypothetical protein [Anaerolineales bacterium]
MNAVDERDIDPVEQMMRIAQDFLHLPAGDFKESFRSTNPATLIYNSEYFRVKLIWGGWDYGGGNSISIRYGRLHAPNEEAKMTWDGEECHCWHRVEHALHFLDGRAPSDAAKLNYSHPITSAFYEEDIRQKFDRRRPEWLAQIHVTIWEHYGKRLFELFDLRRPDLWEQYSQFLREFYDTKGRSPAIKPPLDKVC